MLHDEVSSTKQYTVTKYMVGRLRYNVHTVVGMHCNVCVSLVLNTIPH